MSAGAAGAVGSIAEKVKEVKEETKESFKHTGTLEITSTKHWGKIYNDNHDDDCRCGSCNRGSNAWSCCNSGTWQNECSKPKLKWSCCGAKEKSKECEAKMTKPAKKG